jgi:hypothetical protein
MFHLSVLTIATITWGVIRFGVFAGDIAKQIGPIEGPFKRIIDGTVELAYKRGCLDGFLVGAIVVLILTNRRKQP